MNRVYHALDIHMPDPEPLMRTRGLRANGTKTYAKEITNCYN
ncbi:FlmC family protein [Citrobacter portucalensis]